MYSYERATHRKAKLESRGWEEVSRNRVQRRDLKIEFILENKEEFEFTKEWIELFEGIDEPASMSRGKVWS